MVKKLTDKASIPAVIDEMTLEEKATLVTGGATFETAPIPRLGIPSVTLLDAGSGVNLRQYLSNLLNTGRLRTKTSPSGGIGTLSQLVYILDRMERREELSADEQELLDVFLAYLKELVPSGDLPSCFPVNSLLASTWNPEIVRACAEQVGKEASAFGVDVLLGTPCVNIQRDPRGGRGFEGYSEDPYLASVLAPEYALGVQSQGVMANVKHFALNNQETERMGVDVRVSERAMQEIYFPIFRAVVQQGKVGSVMSSYNSVNGVPASQNERLLKTVLREEMGFDGLVVSDWGGVYDQVASLRAGNDLCMPGPRSIEPIVEAVRAGDLPESCLDEAVAHILQAIVKMPAMCGRRYTDIDSEQAKKVAYRAAAEGIILMKNEADTLPLKNGAHVAFYGEHSRRFADSGVGSGRVHTNKTSSMIEAAKSFTDARNLCLDCVDEQTEAVVVTLFSAGQEGKDRASLQLEAQNLQAFANAADAAADVGARLIVILNVAGPVDLSEIEAKADAILCVYFPGQEGAHAAADILFGKVNPSGKLAQTFPRHLHDVPAYLNFPGENKAVYYGEGLFTGYRYYDVRHIKPLYCFGHGLSYTTFELSELTLEAPAFRYDERDVFHVSVKVRNTGSRAGSETVQLYLKDAHATLMRPVKELKGFAKVALEPGEEKRVVLSLDKRSLSAYDERLHAWVCEPGEFQVMIGTSAEEIALTDSFRAVGKNPYAYGAQTQYTVIAADTAAVDAMLGVLERYAGPNQRILTRGDIARQTAYIAFSFTLQDAYKAYMQPAIVPEDAERVFADICEAVREIDITGRTFQYEEKEVF